MLSDHNIRKINNQIESELKTVNRYIADDDEKAAALDRIMKLKQLLDPKPNPDQIMEAFVQALTSHHRQMTPRPSDAVQTLSDLCAMFRR